VEIADEQGRFVALDKKGALAVDGLELHLQNDAACSAIKVCLGRDQSEGRLDKEPEIGIGEHRTPIEPGRQERAAKRLLYH
jgi:hypothetical protein